MKNKEIKRKLKTIKELREAYRITYNKYVQEINELNEKLIPLGKEVDSILATMEKVYDLSERKE